MRDMINPNDLVAIRNLLPDTIAFPYLDYSTYPNLDLKKTTLHAAFTVIKSKVDASYLHDLNWEYKGNIIWQNNKLVELATAITQMINIYKNERNDWLLSKIFIWIQLWGGNSGRSVFVQGNGWIYNFNIDRYSSAVNYILRNDYKNGLNELLLLRGIGPAFATKHMSFWSDGNAPILDSIISKIVIGRRNAREQDYLYYIEELDELIYELENQGMAGVTRSRIERNLFNWANTSQGNMWIKNRKLK